MDLLLKEIYFSVVVGTINPHLKTHTHAYIIIYLNIRGFNVGYYSKMKYTTLDSGKLDVKF